MQILVQRLQPRIVGLNGLPHRRLHRAHIQRFVDLGFDEIHVHNVGRNQTAFINAFGEHVIPNLKWNNV